ncbi:hypothetical protein CEUSTIGMA_g4854.t1 [Chlamydomonas eustigma]|uniref:Alpha-type protein kinase domain-containing protein n=1 Tax=Chlamydomonas eustigma TaxID=1157962 RepID=A0A250X2W1_9CHLO|nr:hypothetical protein CEUSTIGMA_g4854.t1 [Chlamydomonas eustigma]|eukprot:GAX77408.1 hypothetical protein CEUSTIGMA_g4854.t1 [Chlamydomonas eustigma]
MAWSSGSRTLIHIADAPGHGLRLAPLGVPPEYLRDDHPEFDRDGSQMRKILLRLREDLKETRVKVTKHRDVQSLSKLMAMIDGGNHVSTYEVDAGTINIAPNPFAMGQSRLEELCIGPHVKFNNNCGSVNFNDPQPHLQAFSHWSYEITDKKLMVVDVQGFKELDSSGTVKIVKIVLSDPAHLHSVSREHFNPLSGNMNLLNGPDMFLHSHTSPEINQKLYETMKIKLHGAICETLIPTSKEFRLNQDTKQRATSTAGNSHGQRDETPFRRLGHNGRGQRQGRGQSQSQGQSQNGGQSREQSRQRGGGERSQMPPRRRGARSPSPRRRIPKPQPLESLSSANTESSVARRADIIKSSMKIHDQCRMLLRPKGIPVPNNLVAAIDLCFTEGLIDAATKDKWDQIRVLRNEATHIWNE